MPIWFPSIWGLIRIRNLLSVLYFNLELYFARFAFFHSCCASLLFHHLLRLLTDQESSPSCFEKHSKRIPGFLKVQQWFSLHSSPFSLWNTLAKHFEEAFWKLSFLLPIVSPRICFKKVSEKLLVVLQGFYQDSLLSTEGAARLDLLHRRFHSSCLFLKDISFKNFSSL